MHCYTVPLRSRSTKYRESRTKLARIIHNITTHQQHTINLLHNQHWLPIRSRIMFKVATFCYKVYRLNQSNYFLDTLEPYLPCCGDGLADRSHIETAARRFSSTVSTVWKRLPLAIPNFGSIVTFKSHLKMHLFHRDFLVE